MYDYVYIYILCICIYIHVCMYCVYIYIYSIYTSYASQISGRQTRLALHARGGEGGGTCFSRDVMGKWLIVGCFNGQWLTMG